MVLKNDWIKSMSTGNSELLWKKDKVFFLLKGIDLTDMTTEVWLQLCALYSALFN